MEIIKNVKYREGQMANKSYDRIRVTVDMTIPEYHKFEKKINRDELENIHCTRDFVTETYLKGLLNRERIDDRIQDMINIIQDHVYDKIFDKEDKIRATEFIKDILEKDYIK